MRTNGNVIAGPINAAAVFQVTSSGVTIDGFTIDGDDPSASNGNQLTSGDDADASYGVCAQGSYSQRFTCKTTSLSTWKSASAARAASGGLINQNWFDSVGKYDFGYAVTLRTNYYADVTNNLMMRVQSGLHTNNFSVRRANELALPG